MEYFAFTAILVIHILTRCFFGSAVNNFAFPAYLNTIRCRINWIKQFGTSINICLNDQYAKNISIK